MGWSKNVRRAIRKSTIRQRIRHGSRPVLEVLESRLAPTVNVLTYHDDLGSTGLNAAETQLTPANVHVGSFGKLFAVPMDGQVYAQPLVDTSLTIADGPNTTTGSAGVHDVTFVATEHDSLYAIDTNPTGTGAILWKRSFTDITTPGYSGSTPGTNINSTLGAATITSVPNGDTGTGDVNPEIGITGTPVIDPATNLLFVVVKTKEHIGGSDFYVQRLHAIHIADGTDASVPFLVGTTTNGNDNNTQVYVYGNGDGSVTDPYNGTGQQVVQFNALREAQRGALTFINNKLYIPWASHGDNGPYHGWVMKWDVSNVQSSGFVLTGALCTSPNNGLSGIWQGGGRLAFEANGSAFYFVTGNGSGGAPTLNAAGFPSNANYNEALVKAVDDPSTTPTNQNPNGWGLKIADYFIPFNVGALDGADSDFGSGAPILLPDSAGIPGHPHLIAASGKEGKLYLLDRDNLGHTDPNNDHVLNAGPDGSGHNTAPVVVSGLLNTPAFFNGHIYAVSGYSGAAHMFTINADGTLTGTSQTSIGSFGYLPGSPSVSANGTTNGIVWVMDRNANRIHAYDATTFATELWNSGQQSGGTDNVGAVIKFAVPTIANGEVLVGTANSLVIYGLTQPPNAVPNAPDLSATALSGTSINLTWTDSSVRPNTANGYSIEESTDGVNFSQVTTAPAGATSIAIGALTPTTTYDFRIRGFNALGNSLYSNVASATTTNNVPLLDFTAGFAGSTSKLTYNGSAAINGSAAELTDGNFGEAGSVFSTNPVDITKFTTQFSFQIPGGTDPTADGFTFTIQGNGPTALGFAGGSLGYEGIGASMAIKFDLYNNSGEGVDSTGLYTNGAAPFDVGSIDLSGTGIDLHSGDRFDVIMTYNGTTLMVTETDTSSGGSAHQTYTIDLPTLVGGTTARVGFTGGTGGLTAIQDILSWSYSPTATASPNAPSGLGATPASATSVNLSWTTNSPNQTGFHLDRATDLGFTQNLITEILPATPSMFTDTAIGLAPGNTFFYRLRAFNAAGESGDSNVASVAIPLAPPKPTNQQIIDISTTEIDIRWQDNAGHQADGYKILRAVNHGSFTPLVTLPPTSRPAPSNYDYSDTNLTPGSFYEYHILAFNVSGNNDFAGLNAFTLTDPPAGVTIQANPGSIQLSWTAPAGAISYEIFRGITPGGEAATPYATGLTQTSFTDANLSAGTTFYYEVVAVNGNLAPLPTASAPSAEVSGAALHVFTAGELNQLFVQQLYLDLFNRAADPTGLSRWSTALDLAAMTRTQVAAGLAASAEYHGGQVRDAYQNILGRQPDANGLAQWTAFLSGGGTLIQLQANLFASTEFTLQSGVTVNRFLESLYQDALGRSITPTEEQQWRQLLTSGASRNAVAASVLGSAEAQGDMVQQTYTDLLHRSPDLGTLQAYVSLLLNGAAPATILAGVAGSQEYAQNVGGDANHLYVAQLYDDLLQRPADPTGGTGFTSVLDTGAVTRAQAFQALTHSVEYETLVVQDLFQSILHRPADSVGLNTFRTALAQGSTIEQVEEVLFGSTEYFLSRGSGTNDGFLTALYGDLLNRTLGAPERTAWDQALHGGMTRTQVAASLLASQEYDHDLIASLFDQYLHRPADSAALSQFTTLLQHGATSADITAIILGSAEYFVQT